MRMGLRERVRDWRGGLFGGNVEEEEEEDDSSWLSGACSCLVRSLPCCLCSPAPFLEASRRRGVWAKARRDVHVWRRGLDVEPRQRRTDRRNWRGLCMASAGQVIITAGY